MKVPFSTWSIPHLLKYNLVSLVELDKFTNVVSSNDPTPSLLLNVIRWNEQINNYISQRTLTMIVGVVHSVIVNTTHSAQLPQTQSESFDYIYINTAGLKENDVFLYNRIKIVAQVK